MLQTARQFVTAEAPKLEDQRWAAICARTRPQSDPFVYAVRTTGVYCLPGCASRRPRRENVQFFDAPQAARDAGFRPCLRCRPGETAAQPIDQAIVKACRLIEQAETPPSLKALAAAVGVSPFHFQRRFKAALGVSPADYARGARGERLRAALAQSPDITGAIYDAGFNSAGRFYDQADATLGMTPSVFRAGGPDETIHFAYAPCWLGGAMVAATRRGVCAITLGEDPDALLDDLKRRFARAELKPAGPSLQALVDQVMALIAAPGLGHALPLDIRGAAFQQRVWRALTRIPPGQTASYAQIAKAIGAPKAARAVARACADNPLAVAVPCHRVVRADGALSGYRWGVERKRALLDRESGDRGP